MVEAFRTRRKEGDHGESPLPSIEIAPYGTIGEDVIKMFGDKRPKVNVMSHHSLGMGPTMELSQKLVDDGFTVVPHLAARHIKDQEELERIAGQLEAAGIDEIFIVKGEDAPQGDYSTAIKLMQGLAKTDFRPKVIGIAGYPEKVGEIERERLLRSIKERKVLAEEMGAELRIATQMCFDADKILRYAEILREEIDVPVTVGLAVHGSRRKLHEMVEGFGVGDSRAVLLSEGPDSPYSPRPLMDEILARDEHGRISGFHVYTFNQLDRLQDLLS